MCLTNDNQGVSLGTKSGPRQVSKRTQVTRRHGAALVTGTAWGAQWRTDTGNSNKVGSILGERVGISTTKSQLSGLGVFETQRLPVEQL